MKTITYLFILILSALFNVLFGQSQNIDSLLKKLPEHVEQNKSIPTGYQMITDYHDYDLAGNFIRKIRVSGKYTCGLKGGRVRWNDVTVAHSNQLNEAYPPGIKQTAMDGFNYLPNTNILDAAFYDQLPDANFLIKNLLWDTFGFEGFASWYWDSLKLNDDYAANELNTTVDMAGQGTFTNKEFKLRWLGITKMNNKICAIISYSTMNNKVTLTEGELSLQGRSHYWGEVYVSLQSQQLEYAKLTEDVITDVKFTNQQNNVLGYTVRYITFTKLDTIEK